MSVAGLGGCGLLLHEAARGWPAPRQALHGPRLHAAAAAGRALREAQATVTLGCWVLGPPRLPRSPTTTRLLPVVPPYDWWWVLDQILDFSQVWTLGRRACKSECSHHQGLGGHEKAAHIWGHRLWSFVECRHQASLSAAPGREMTSQLPPRQSDTEPLPDWSTGTLVPFKSPGGSLERSPERFLTWRLQPIAVAPFGTHCGQESGRGRGRSDRGTQTPKPAAVNLPPKKVTQV